MGMCEHCMSLERAPESFPGASHLGGPSALSSGFLPKIMREFPTIRGPDIDRNEYGSYYKGTHQKDSQFVETGIRFLMDFGARNLNYWVSGPSGSAQYSRSGSALSSLILPSGRCVSSSSMQPAKIPHLSSCLLFLKFLPRRS